MPHHLFRFPSCLGVVVSLILFRLFVLGFSASCRRSTVVVSSFALTRPACGLIGLFLVFSVDVVSVDGRCPVCVAVWFICILGCRSRVFGISPCMCLTGVSSPCFGFSPPSAQLWVAATRRGSARVDEGVYEVWELDLRCLRPLHCARDPPMASPSLRWLLRHVLRRRLFLFFSCSSGFSFVFRVCLVFWVCFSCVSGLLCILGLWVLFGRVVRVFLWVLGGLLGWGAFEVGLGVLWGLLMFFGLWVSCGFLVLCVLLVGFGF
jgi:hypothetical protein